MTGTRLADVLMAAGVIDATQVVGATGEGVVGDVNGAELLAHLAARDGFSEEGLARSIAEHIGVPYVDLAQVAPDARAIEVLPRKLAKRYGVAPLGLVRGTLSVAMTDPTDILAIDDLKVVTGIGRVDVAVAGPSAIREAQRRFYAAEAVAGEVLSRFGRELTTEIVAEEGPVTGTEDAGSLEAAAHEGPIVSLVGAILSDAIRNRATDVHVEPGPETVRVRHRIDGLLRDSVTLPMNVHAGVTSRFKIISGMDITERRKPQDGRSRIVLDGESVDSRVSSIPTQYGEKVVVRLLRRLEQDLTMSGLGLFPEQEAILKEHLEFPHGLILFTGPTGAGKTSTMYAGLGHLQRPTTNLVSLEDPIEYEISGVNQIQVSERGGVTFPSGLRSLLRQDPDVIMVGEIRDLETAQMVMRASATGHLVLSSLHTNDAASAVSRVVGLGLEAHKVAEALSLVISQRLVRVLCDRCSVVGPPSEQTLARLGLGRDDVPGEIAQVGEGCEACGNTGYLGRTAIYELLPVTQEVRAQILRQTTELPSFSANIVGGTLRSNGLTLAARGVTTLEEVLRVTHSEAERTSSCPSCSAAVRSDFVICPLCRTDLMKEHCRTCGGAVEAEWQACPFCTSDLSSPSRTRPRTVVRLPATTEG